MIKNIIFDIGGVLTEFDPNDYLGAFGFEGEKANTLSHAIFRNSLWKEYMVGNVSPDEFKANVIKENSQYKDEIEFILAKENTYKLLPPLQDGIDFLLKVKKEGYNIFILSNIVKDSLDYFKSNFKDVTSVLSGAVYSCEVGLKKPDEKIYSLILDRYNLESEETLFLDDQEKNIGNAEKLGIVAVAIQPMLKEGEFERIKKLLQQDNS